MLGGEGRRSTLGRTGGERSNENGRRSVRTRFREEREEEGRGRTRDWKNDLWVLNEEDERGEGRVRLRDGRVGERKRKRETGDIHLPTQQLSVDRNDYTSESHEGDDHREGLDGLICWGLGAIQQRVQRKPSAQTQMKTRS